MFSIGVELKWLAGLSAESRAMVGRTLEAARAHRPVLALASGAGDADAMGLPVASALPAEQAGHTWVVIGEGGTGRGDVIALRVGGERREAGVSWVRGPHALAALADVRADSGLAQAMARLNATERDAAIRKGFAGALDRLAATGAAYVFGAKRLGTLVGTGLAARGWRVETFLENNNAAWGTHASGVRIAGVDAALDRRLPVIIGTTRFPFTLGEQLRQAGFEHVIPYPVMTLVDATAFPTEIPYIETASDIALNRNKYLSEYLNYADARSRAVLDALLKYRLTLDARRVQGHFEPESEQYFDRDLVRFGAREAFVDAGGFDGQTTLNFLNRAAGAETRVFYFEPDPGLMERSRVTLAGHGGVTFCQAGAFSRDGTVSFSTTGTTNGSIGEAAGAVGDLTIDVKRIDDVATVAATFIKMDIEGAEFDALRGAQRQIADHAPRLAIAAYHKGSDIWRLGELIRDLNPAYRLDLRHYTEGGLETVIYATTDKHV